MKKIIALLIVSLAVPFIFASCSGTSGGEVTDTRQSTLFEDERTEERTDLIPESSSTESPSAVTGLVPEMSDNGDSDKNTNLSQAVDEAASDVREALSDN